MSYHHITCNLTYNLTQNMSSYSFSEKEEELVELWKKQADAKKNGKKLKE